MNSHIFRLISSSGRSALPMGVSLFFISVFMSILLVAPHVHSAPSISSFKIIRTYPHDEKAFTQGLVFHGGFLYEGTGLYGRSSVRKVRLETGEVVRRRELPDNVFGEGLTLWRDRLIQVTWRSETGYIYDEASFRLIGQFHYRGEGWGITSDGKQLIMSDGSATLRVLDPDTLAVKRKIEVRDGGMPVSGINELEYVKGEIYANIFPTDRIARISPRTGRVLGWVDLSSLRGREGPWLRADALNGIAYASGQDRLFVTGKFWPAIFEIALPPRMGVEDARARPHEHEY